MFETEVRVTRSPLMYVLSLLIMRVAPCISAADDEQCTPLSQVLL